MVVCAWLGYIKIYIPSVLDTEPYRPEATKVLSLLQNRAGLTMMYQSHIFRYNRPVHVL
jgi:hypothetical protein